MDSTTKLDHAAHMCVFTCYQCPLKFALRGFHWILSKHGDIFFFWNPNQWSSLAVKTLIQSHVYSFCQSAKIWMLPLWRYCARCYGYSGKWEKGRSITEERGNPTQPRDRRSTPVDVNASPKMTTDSCAAVLEKNDPSLEKKKTEICRKRYLQEKNKNENKLLGWPESLKV